LSRTRHEIGGDGREASRALALRPGSVLDSTRFAFMMRAPFEHLITN
jgi:hypothetical protein